jgi:hypothetical protein
MDKIEELVKLIKNLKGDVDKVNEILQLLYDLKNDIKI